jgi:hypothetical protein
MKSATLKTKIILLLFSSISLTLSSQVFTEQTSIPLPGVSSGTVKWGDYNNDGYLDILLAGFAQDNSVIVKVFRNNGNNTFTDQGNIFSPALPAAYGYYSSNSIASWFDFDNDGYLDIMINGPNSTSGNVLMIYRNEGNNTFTRKLNIDYLTWQGGNSVDCGDYDNDGDLDILLTTSIATKILQNQGNFVFTEQTSVPLIGLNGSTAKWIDYDNDGDLDIFLTGQNNWTSYSILFQNQGSNTFVRQTGISFQGVYRGSGEWGDYNGDSYPDLLLTGNGSTVIYKNNGNNTFSLQSGISLKGVSNGVGKWGDLDNDGDLDIIISGDNNNTYITKIYLNNGNNTFTEQTAEVIDGVTESYADLGDYDNDGDLDILISGDKGISKICKVFKNGSSVINPTPAAPTGLVTSVAGSDMILKWRPVTTDNTVSRSISYNVMVGTAAGGIDLVSPNSSPATGFRKIPGIGNGQFDTTFILRNIRKTTYYWKVQAVDNSFKGSAFSSQSTFSFSALYQAYGLNVPNIGGKESGLAWSRGNGANCIVFMREGNTGIALPVNNTTYTAAAIFKSGSQILTSGWYCVYKGTQTSVRVTGLKANTDYIFQVFEFDGSSGTEQYNTQTSVNNPFSFKTGGFTELINTVLQPVTSFNLMYAQNSYSYWIDIDNDNDVDLFLLGQSNAYLYRNDGNDVFTMLPLPFSGGYAASWGDYNNDGFIDLIILTGGSTKIYKNNGNNTFTEQTGISLPGVAYGNVAWGDYDNDGDLDIVLCGDVSGTGHITKIFRNNGNNTFTEQTLISLEQVAYGSVKWGDYDNDGFLDLIISGSTNDSREITKIYRNTRNNNFTEQTSIVLPGSAAGMLDWGDYDNDGYLDILLSDFSYSKVFRNNGNGTFTEQTGISLSEAGYSSAEWGDFNNDGYLDILLSGFVTGYIPFTKIYKNNGNNTFTEDITSTLPSAGYSSATWGDYDNDGDLDIILTGNSVNAAFSKIFRNDIEVANVKPAAPTGVVSSVNKSDVLLKWKSVRTDVTGYKGMSYNVKVGTVSGGINIVSPHSSITGYRRLVTTGNGNLDTTYYLKNLPFGNYFWSVQAVDNGFAGGTFSSEGTFSIVPVQAKNLSAKIINNNSITLKWGRGNGDRCVVFCKQTSSGLASPVNNTDYIADGEYDFGGQIGSSGWYCIYNGRSDSVSVTGLVYKAEYSFHVIEYMGSSGSEQYFTQVVDGNPGVFSTGLFAQQAGITLNSTYNNPIAWGDYDNDGFLDILIPGFPTRIYHNNGDNTFSEVAGLTLPGVSYGAAAWGDYDNDGDLDILISGASVNSYPPTTPLTKIYRNDGSNIFTEQTSISLTGVYYSSVAWGDYDNDGDLDVLVTGATGSDPNFNPVTKIYRNNGNNTFTEQSQISLTNVFKGSAVWGDYDNDGDLDILLNGALDYQYYTNNVSKIYRNNGNNSFTEQTQIVLPGFSFSSSAWGDFDNDGYLDFLMTELGKMSIYQNTGNGNFTNYDNVSLSYQGPCSAAWGDYDNDGYLDILLTNPGLDSKIFRNTRGISYGSYTQWFNQQDDEALKSAGYGFVSWADYDNDGDLDFLMGEAGKPTVIYKNNLIMKSGLLKSNTAPSAPVGMAANYSPAGVTLKWNTVKNDETPFKSMAYNVSIGTKKDSTNICPSQAASTGFRRIPAIGNAQMDTSFLIKNLSSRKYYWKVQAVDQGYKGGAWSAVDSFVVRNVQTFFKTDTVCLGFATHFTDQSVATGGIASWQWDFKDGTKSSVQNPVHLFSSGGNYNVKLVITSNSGTKDSLEKITIVKPRPKTGFTALSSCQGAPTTITNTTNNNGLIISSWYWNFGDGQNSIVQQPSPHGYLGPGNYTVLLKALANNGCLDSIVKTVTVGNYPVAVVTTNKPLTFCKGDSITLSVGYNANYAYQWLINGTGITNADSNSYIAKLSGNYSVEATNLQGNCKSTSSAVIVNAQNNPVKPVIKSDSYQSGICLGENPIKLNVSQIVAGYSYKWSRNGLPVSNATSSYIEGFLDQGVYTVEADLNGCKAQSDTFNVKFQDALPKPVIYAQGPIVWYLACSNDSASQYKWYYNGTIIAGANKYIYVANKNLGQYSVSIANAKGCYTPSDVITIPPTTGIYDADPFTGLQLYPNPTRGLFTVEMDNQVFGDLNIKIITQEGKEILGIKFEKTTMHFSGRIDMSGQAKGIYFISLDMKGNISNRKIILE